MRYLPAELVLILFAIVCSCGETDRVTGTVIGPEGGTVTGPGGALLQVPAGALDEKVEIWIEKVSGSPGGFNPVGDIYEFGPPGTVFASPVTVSLPYDESLVTGAESAVRAWWSQSIDGDWAPLDGSPDTARNTVSGPVTHFSFGAPGEPLPCNPECTGRECGPDGCGGQCPPGCGAGEVCNETSGTCECNPDCGTRVCGPDPVCGTDCGQCGQGEICTQDGRCVPTGQGPRVCPDPTVVDFGDVQPGDTQDLSFNLKNCGQEDLELYGVSLDPVSSSDFSLLNLPVFPQVLIPDASVDITVRYSPAAFGSDSGAVEIYSNDPASDPQTHLTGTISLLGESFSQSCDVDVWPPAATFGTVASGGADTIDLVLSNTGGAACTFYDAQITQNSADSEFSIISAPAPDTILDPGGLLQIKVQYAPVNLGADAGVLTISTSWEEGDILVDLSGEGVAETVCDLVMTPDSTDFGTLRPGYTSQGTITLENIGTGDCTVSAVELRTSIVNPSEFILTNAQTPLVIDRAGQPNSTFLLEVTFAPTQTGVHSGAVAITTDDPDLQYAAGMLCNIPPINLGQACVSLSGSCTASRIEVLPIQIDFGLVTVGCNSSQSSVTVFNLDAATLNINDVYFEDPGDPNFEIVSCPALPIELISGASVEIGLTYHPQDANPHGTMLYIESDATNAALLSVPLQGRGTTQSDQTDIFQQPSGVKSDVLFVVDNSGSMGEEQTALAQNFSEFINYAIAGGADYHIGVIAVEVNDAETGVGTPSRDIYPGVLVQAPGCPRIITNSTPDIEGCFTDNVSLGTCCSDEQEAGLQAAWMALTPPEIDDPTKNAGFLREDAKLYVIFVSDEQDQSSGTPDFYVEFFESIKGPYNTEMMKVSAIVGDSPNGCATADNGSRYIEVANRTGGIFESICTSNWAQALRNLGVDAFAAFREYSLSRPADPLTITVTVDSLSVPKASCEGCPNGWTHYSGTNSVYFGDDVVPAPGSQIDITYTAACL